MELQNTPHKKEGCVHSSRHNSKRHLSSRVMCLDERVFYYPSKVGLTCLLRQDNCLVRCFRPNPHFFDSFPPTWYNMVHLKSLSYTQVRVCIRSYLPKLSLDDNWAECLGDGMLFDDTNTPPNLPFGYLPCTADTPAASIVSCCLPLVLSTPLLRPKCIRRTIERLNERGLTTLQRFDCGRLFDRNICF